MLTNSLSLLPLRLSLTTLEEVFLTVAEAAQLKELQTKITQKEKAATKKKDKKKKKEKKDEAKVCEKLTGVTCSPCSCY